MRRLFETPNGGCSSVGRATDCGSVCRGFESHQPPQKSNDIVHRCFFLFVHIPYLVLNPKDEHVSAVSGIRRWQTGLLRSWCPDSFAEVRAFFFDCARPIVGPVERLRQGLSVSIWNSIFLFFKLYIYIFGKTGKMLYICAGFCIMRNQTKILLT